MYIEHPANTLVASNKAPMALDTITDGVATASLQDLADSSLPIFKVERVQLQFSISSDFVAAQVANNVLILALSTGRILRIDLDSPGDIDGESSSALPIGPF